MAISQSGGGKVFSEFEVGDSGVIGVVGAGPEGGEEREIENELANEEDEVLS